MGITAGSREVPGRNACDRDIHNNNNNSVQLNSRAVSTTRWPITETVDKANINDK